jgi:UDP-glucose 4-epimerase
VRYFITGGAGFIGSHLVEALVAEGNHVSILDNLSTGSPKNLEEVLGDLNTRLEFGDVQDSVQVNRMAACCDVIVHLAAAVGVRRILADPLEGIRTNVAGTENVLDAARRFNKPIFVASTSEVYGKSEQPSLCETSDSVFGSADASRWSYATSKKLDEYLALGYHNQHGVKAVVSRFFNVVGPRQTRAYGAVLPNFVSSALANEPIRVFGDGKQTRCFTAVWDCVDAIRRLLATPSAYGQVFNIGAPNQTTMLGLAEKVRLITGSRSRIEFVPYDEAYPEGGFEDMRSRTPCACKIRKYAGWVPTATLEDIIAATAEDAERNSEKGILTRAGGARRGSPVRITPARFAIKA